MDEILEVLIYIEFDAKLEEASSNPITYRLPYIPRIGETVRFDTSTFERLTNEYTTNYLKKTNTKIRDYSKVIDIQYGADSGTIFIVLGYKTK